MAWRVAKSLDVLLGEINASAPNRSKASDGSIGDEDHQNSTSDHNPWCQGWVVTARDFTHDPAGGFDSYAWAEWQRQRCRGDILIDGKRETRVKYIISNRRIASPTNNWAWRSYSGDSDHTGHAHISVDCTAENGAMDSTTPWGWSSNTEVDMWCKKGDVNTEAVWNLQQRLWLNFNTSLVVDGNYGTQTVTVLKAALGEVGWNVPAEVFNRGEVAALEWAIARRAALAFGKPGPAGPTGSAGPQGPKGDPGMDGADAVLETGTGLTVTIMP